MITLFHLQWVLNELLNMKELTVILDMEQVISEC